MKKTSVMGVEDEDESEDQEKAPLIRHERESDTENDLVQGVEACVKSKWPPRKSSDRTVFLAVFIAALGPLGFGFATGYSSPALEDLLQDGSKPRLTRDEGAWFSVSEKEFFESGTKFSSRAKHSFKKAFATRRSHNTLIFMSWF